MKFHHYIITALYPFKRLIYFIKKYLFGLSNDQLRVLLYHDIPIEKHLEFYNQLIKLQKSWNFISPKEFSDILNKKSKLKGRNLLITFDDGYNSNRLVAKNILNLLGIKAIFFVVSDFVDIKNRNVARKYVSTNIYPSLKLENIPESYYNMRWNHLKQLIKDGHSIGAHTKTHPRLSNIKSKNELLDEIVNSANYIEKTLDISINYFAFPFGNKDSFSREAFMITKNRFDFIFSGLRGDNNHTSKNFVLFRDSINLNFSNTLIASFLEGSSDFFYKNSKKEMDLWIN